MRVRSGLIIVVCVSVHHDTAGQLSCLRCVMAALFSGCSVHNAHDGHSTAQHINAAQHVRIGQIQFGRDPADLLVNQDYGIRSL